MERVLGIGGYQVRVAGGDVVPGTHDIEGVGRFGCVIDPEGRRVDLWQTA